MRERRLTPGTDGQHPDVDMWIAYHGGDLPGNDEDRLRGHLAKCPACVSLVLDLAAFSGIHDDRAEVSEFEMAAAWRALRASLHEAPPREAPPRQAPPRQAPPRLAERRVPLPLALAASLLVGALGLTFWGLEHRSAEGLRNRVAVLSEPHLNLSISDLEPNMATRSGGIADPEEVSRGDFSVLIMLPTETFETYQVEIVGDENQVVWASPALAPHADLGTLTVGLPPGFLEPGDYRVQLYGRRGDERFPLDDDLPIRAVP